MLQFLLIHFSLTYYSVYIFGYIQIIIIYSIQISQSSDT